MSDEIELLEQRLEFAEWEWGRSDEARLALEARNAKLVAALNAARAFIHAGNHKTHILLTIDAALALQQSTEKP